MDGPLCREGTVKGLKFTLYLVKSSIYGSRRGYNLLASFHSKHGANTHTFVQLYLWRIKKDLYFVMYSHMSAANAIEICF